MELKDCKEIFESLFGFDISNFSDMYKHSRLQYVLVSLEDAENVKKAYDALKKEFGWEIDYSIHKYGSSSYGGQWYALYSDDEKIEQQISLVKRLGIYFCPIGVPITTLLSSKNCTKLSNVAIAIIVARGEIIELKESGAFIKEYDSNNNLIHIEHISGIFEAWYEYDDKNRKIHYKNSSSEETWYEYYDNRKLKSARYKVPNSEVMYQYDYDENGVLKGCTKLKQNNEL